MKLQKFRLIILLCFILFSVTNLTAQEKFDEFKREYLRINYGFNRENLDEINDLYDLFICGSDQIWSVLEHNFNGFFYLDFAKKKKVSYAVSNDSKFAFKNLNKNIPNFSSKA